MQYELSLLILFLNLSLACSNADGTKVESHPDITTDLFKVTAEHPRYTEGSVIDLADGSLLYSISQFSAGPGDHATAHIVATKSYDGGQTWLKPYDLQENIGTQVTVNGAGRVTLNENGLYLIQLDISFVKTGNIRVISVTQLSDDTGATFLTNSTSYGYHRNEAEGYGTTHITYVYNNIASPTSISVFCNLISPSGDLVPDVIGTRIFINKLS